MRDKRTSEILVMKQIKIQDCNPGDLQSKLSECSLMKNLRHPYICRFKNCFQDQKMLCILFEYCDKGDLDIYIKNQHGMMISEAKIKKFILETTLAIDYLHSQGVIHRDLKPSNIFLKGKEYSVQVGDFGIACNSNNGCIIEDVGTLLYQSPEILDDPSGHGAEGYDCRTDIWSLGCIIFQMCNFDVPFNALNEVRLIEKIKKTKHRGINEMISSEIRSIYEICMNKDYQTRPHASDILKLDFVLKWAKDLKIMNHQLLRYGREKCQTNITSFLEATERSLKKYDEPVRLIKSNPIQSVLNSAY